MITIGPFAFHMAREHKPFFATTVEHMARPELGGSARLYAWQGRSGDIRLVPSEEHFARLKQANYRAYKAFDRRLGVAVWYEAKVWVRHGK